MKPAPQLSIPGLECLDVLGRGGMGLVVRARERATGRELAVKLLQPARGDDAAALKREERFRREGELVARLRHPGIVRVVTAGELPDGRSYLAFELVEGARSLEEASAEAPLEQRLEWLQAAAEALAYAHAEGVVHRDVKPENLLVDGQGRLRVTDFGLGAAEDLERLTQSGSLVGTPAYMAPEQLEGRRSAVGPATDVWALGICLYQALTDTQPFEARNLAQLMYQVRELELTPPRRRRPSAPRALEAVCLRALRKAPSERYPDAAAFAEALRQARARRTETSSGYGTALLIAALVLVVGPAAVLLLDPLGRSAANQTRPASLPDGDPLPAPSLSSPSSAPVTTPNPPGRTGEPAPFRLLATLPELSELPKPAPVPRPRTPNPLAGHGLHKYVQGQGPDGSLETRFAIRELARQYRAESQEPHYRAWTAYWFQRGADLGDDGAMVELAILYRKGDGVRQDPRAALYWLLRAHALQSPAAAREIGLEFLRGRTLLRRDHGQAEPYLREALRRSELDGNEGREPDALVGLARLLVERARGQETPQADEDLGEAARLAREALRRPSQEAAAALLEACWRRPELAAPGEELEVARRLLEWAREYPDEVDPVYIARARELVEQAE